MIFVLFGPFAVDRGEGIGLGVLRGVGPGERMIFAIFVPFAVNRGGVSALAFFAVSVPESE